VKPFTTFDVTVETVTPLHIGSGIELLRNYDFVTENREFIVLDFERVYEQLFDNTPEDQWRRVASLPLAQALNIRGARDLAKYRLPIANGASDEGFEGVRAHIRDGFGRAYLPASSLKGAIRTAFAVAFAAEVGQEWVDGKLREVTGRRPRREFAAQALDQDVFGARPNNDALRAIRPSDLYAATDDESAALELVETRVVKRNGDSTATIMVEAMPTGTTLRGTMTVDRELAYLDQRTHDDWAGLLPFPALGAIAFLRKQSEALIAREKTRFAGSAVGAEYVALERRQQNLPETEALVWVGWGSGWTAKTYGEALTASPEFPQVAGTFRLGSAGRDPMAFPTTRRLVFSGERATKPMGWAVVSITPRGER
jgi:CRISPR-associated protein Csm5